MVILDSVSWPSYRSLLIVFVYKPRQGLHTCSVFPVPNARTVRKYLHSIFRLMA